MSVLEPVSASHAVDEELPRVVVHRGPGDAIEQLLLALADGDREALAPLMTRIGGLVRANIRRVLRDASRSDAVTREFFDDVPREAGDFDPDRDSAQAWLLTRAHQRATSGLTAAAAAAAAAERTELAAS